MDSGERNSDDEKKIMGIKFGYKTDRGFMKTIVFMFISFILEQDATGDNQGLC